MSNKNIKKHPTLLKSTKSTPSDQTQGCRVDVTLAKRASYTVNIRSFHPNIKFERLGFRFEGDSRGFSLQKSGHDSKRVDEEKPEVTSRIYQRFKLDLSKDVVINKATKKDDQPPDKSFVTASNTSRNTTPIIGAITSDGAEYYIDPEFRPSGRISGKVETVDCGQVVADIQSRYEGKNFAFLGSRVDQKTLGTTVVPSLDVNMHLWVRLEPVNHYVDIIVLVNGDGFPNCEAHITDGKGQSLFLGTHIRIGSPSTHLFGDNKRFMFAHALRVGIDSEGNFKDTMWGFAHVLGAAPKERDDYPIADDLKTDKEQGFPNDIERIGDGKAGSSSYAKPLYVPARTGASVAWTKLRQSFTKGPVDRGLTRTQWNNYHLSRNPNAGRSPDAYDYKPK